MNSCSFDFSEQKIELIYKFSLNIDMLFISDDSIQKLSESYREKLVRLKINVIYFNMSGSELSAEVISILNEIKPIYLWIDLGELSSEVVKAAFSVKSINLYICHIDINKLFTELLFLHSQFIFLDSSCNQKLFYKCESVTFGINLKGFEKMHLIKEDTDSWKDANCLFIPLEAIEFFQINGKIDEFDPSDLNEQLKNINTESLANSGFIVPCRHLDQTYFY